MSSKQICDEDSRKRRAKAVIVYDHLETMLLANQLLRGVPPPRPDFAGDWIVNSWQFDLLEQRHEAESALIETSDANLMIVALSDAKALREWPEAWLTRWVSVREYTDAALVLMLNRTANRPEAWPAVIVPMVQLVEGGHLEFCIADDAEPGADMGSAFHPLGELLSGFSNGQTEFRYFRCPLPKQMAECVQRADEKRRAVA